MRLSNFTLSDDNIGLETESDGYLDLHNNFELVNFRYDFSTRGLVINWRKSDGSWVPKYSFTKFRLEFKNVTVLRTKEIDQDTLIDFPEDDVVTDQIGLTNKDDREYLGVLSYVEIRNAEDAMCIYTVNGQGIIVYAETVELIKETDRDAGPPV